MPVSALQSAPESGDRFVFSYRFAALSNTGENGRPVLTKAQWVYLAKAAGLGGDVAREWHEWHSGGQPTPDERGQPSVYTSRAAAPEGEATMRMRLAEMRTPSQPPADDGNGDDPFGLVLGKSQHDVLLDLARSEIGLLFLDRTRLRPAGFVVGEHLHTMALAAGEEVVLEQRSFVQRESASEATTEAERTREEESTTSWTKETADTIAGALSHTRSDGFTAGGSVGFEYGPIKAGVNAGQSDNATSADSDTRTGSTKEVAARTSKNAAKLRDLHKTVFRLSTTDRFERSTRRTIRNPNLYTPIDLHWFKVLQRMRFSHERYGVRLCWTPFVKDPAGDFFAAETTKREALLKRARDSVPAVSPPPEPVISQVVGTRIVGLDPPMTELNHWGGWPGSDMSHDYTLPINVPSGMKWDGDVGFLQGSMRPTLTGAPRGFNVTTVNDPWEVVNANGDRTIFQIVHAGATWRLTGSSQLWVSLSARVIPDATSLSQQQATAMAEWEAIRKQLTAERNAKVAVAEQEALAEFERWRAEHRASLNPAQELMRRFINAMFPADQRDEIAELDVWQQVFDWDMASARLYAGTWNNDGQLRNPSLPADDFVNASWGRLYLPVRPGFEGVLLRMIFLRSSAKGPECVDAYIAKVVTELSDWRNQHLGGPEEVTVTPVPGQVCPQVEQKYVCLGTWTEDLPTDGVHLEVTQATTTAADVLTGALADVETQRALAAVAALVADGKMSAAVAGATLDDVDVHLHMPNGRS